MLGRRAPDRRPQQQPDGQREHALLVRRRHSGPVVRCGQCAVDSVVTGGEPSSEDGGLVLEPGLQPGGEPQRLTGVGGEDRTEAVPHQRRAALGRDQEADHRGGAAGQLDGIGRQRSGRRHVAAEPGGEPGRTARVVEHDVDPSGPDSRHPRLGEGRQVDPRRQGRSAYLGGEPLRPRAHPGAQRSRRPDMDQHAGQVGSGDHDGRATSSGWAAAGGEGVAQGGRDVGVTEDAVAPAQQPRRAWLERVPGGGGVLGDQRGRDPDQLVGGQGSGIDRGRAEGRLGQHADQPEVGSPPTRRAGGEDAGGQLGTREALLVEPAQELELLGPGQVAAGLLVGPGRRAPVRPGRRPAVAEVGDPAPGPGLARVLRHRL